MHSTKRTKHSVLPPFPEYEDYEITKTITNQHKELPRDSLIINSPTVCNINAKNQRKEEINAEKLKNIQHFKEGVLTKIVKVIEEVRFEIIASRREQQEIIRKLDTLFTQNNNNTNVNKFSRLLPISSMECFDEIDQCLINSEEDFISLVKYLNLASRETVKELVPSVMKLLIKKTVSIHFSGCEIVSKKLQDASRSEILQKISKFLAESGDREGGRKERAKSIN